MKVLLVLFVLGVAVFAVPIEDLVITKFDDGGPRFQYMTGPDGSELVDLWLKNSDVANALEYNPETDNNYHLFTRENPNASQPIPFLSTRLLESSNFDSDRKTVFIIHGWNNLPTSNFNVQMVNAYLTAEDVNLIMVDWSAGAVASYTVAFINSMRSAEHVANYITWLIDSSGNDISRCHMIGHSLGAQQAGIIGRHLGGRIPYLTGLDPALPGWITNPQSISSDVAQYTEVIHTDAGYSGIVNPGGDVDFYPNGGRDMPGCDSNNCGHHRSVFYMAESLISGGFTGSRCGSLAEALTGNCAATDNLHMGGTTPKTGLTGIFYVPTNAGPPFSIS